MNRTETLYVMTLAAQITGPVPEGDAWDLTAAAWTAVLSDVLQADVLRGLKAHVADTSPTSPTDARPQGTWWPKPSRLLALIRKGPGLSDVEAWALVRPLLGRSDTREADYDALPLTPGQRHAVSIALPSSFTLRRMGSRDLDALQGIYIAACGAYTLVVVKAEPLQLAEHATTLDISDLLRKAGCGVPEPVRRGEMRAGGGG